MKRTKATAGRRGSAEKTSPSQTQQASSVFVVDLVENLIGQSDSINAPTSLRGNWRWRIIEVLIFGFKKSVIDLVKLIAENLLWRFIPMRRRVCCKQDSVLILVEELSSHSRLATKFTDARRDINVHIWITVQRLSDSRQVFRICVVQSNQVCLRVSLHDAISRLL